MDSLDDDTQERVNKVQHSFNQCDPAPGVTLPERTITAPDGTVTHVGSQSVSGGLLLPYQKGGELVTPAHSVQLTAAILGDDGYEKFKAAKGNSNEFVKEAMALR